MLVVLIGSTITSDHRSRMEFWPEIDVYAPLNKKVRLFFLFTTTQSEETKSNLEGQFGAHVDYTVNSRFGLRAGYRYGFSIKEVHPFKEHRPLLEETLRQRMSLKILLSDRNREEFRFVKGQFSFRYNRITLELEFVTTRSITPYISMEAYHDSRFKAWNRNRLTAGLQIQLKKALPLLSLIDPENR